MPHREVLVEVLLSEVDELRENEVARSSQATYKNATCEKSSESHMWGSSGAVAPNQGQVGWLTKGIGGESEAEQGVVRDELHVQRPAIKEGLSNGMERIGV